MTSRPGSRLFPTQLRPPLARAPLEGIFEHYPLDEASGARSGKRGNTLTDNNTVTSAAGLRGALAASFAAASSEHLSRADEAAFRFGDINWSLVIWVNLADKAANYLIASKWLTTGNQREWEVFYAVAGTDRYRMVISPDGTTTAGVLADSHGVPTAGQWDMVYIEHDADQSRIGIAVNNGRLDYASHARGSFGGTSNFEIGSTGNPNLFLNGQAALATLYKGRILSYAERLFLWNGGKGRLHAEMLDFPR